MAIHINGVDFLSALTHVCLRRALHLRTIFVLQFNFPLSYSTIIATVRSVFRELRCCVLQVMKGVFANWQHIRGRCPIFLITSNVLKKRVVLRTIGVRLDETCSYWLAHHRTVCVHSSMFGPWIPLLLKAFQVKLCLTLYLVYNITCLVKNRFGLKKFK